MAYKKRGAKKKSPRKKIDVAEAYKNAIEELFNKSYESKNLPWQRGWKLGVPVSYATGKPYQGKNLILLDRPGEWLTFNAAKKAGGTVVKGSRAKHIVCIIDTNAKRRMELLNKIGAARVSAPQTVPALQDELKKLAFVPRRKWQPVHSIYDTEGVESKLPPVEENPIDFNQINSAAEDLIDNWIVPIKYVSNRAYCSYSDETIMLPAKTAFKSMSEFYSTAFHEMIHSTGFACMMERDVAFDMNDPRYAKEELVAEFGAMFLRAEFKVECDFTDQQNDAYIKHWADQIGDDWDMVTEAIELATKAKNLVMEKYREVKNVSDGELLIA